MTLPSSDGDYHFHTIRLGQSVLGMQAARHDLSIYFDGQTPLRKTHVHEQLRHGGRTLELPGFAVDEDLHDEMEC
jgi:hypothetical protein